MKKNEFMIQLKKRTKHLSKKEQRKIIFYYEEMIADKLEAGISEEQAIQEIHLNELEIKEASKDRMGQFFYILCSPIIFCLYLTGYILLISLWVFIISLILIIAWVALSSILTIGSTIYLLFLHPVISLLQFGCILFVSGISIFIFLSLPYLIHGANFFMNWLFKNMVSYGKEMLGYEK